MLRSTLLVAVSHVLVHVVFAGIGIIWPQSWLREFVTSLAISEAIIVGLWFAMGPESLFFRLAYPPLTLILILLIHRIPPSVDDVVHFSAWVVVAATFVFFNHKLGVCRIDVQPNKEVSLLVPRFTVGDVIACMLMLAIVLGFASWGTEPGFVAEVLAVVFGTGVGVFMFRDRNPSYPTILALVLAFIVTWQVKFLRRDPQDEWWYFFIGWVSVPVVAASLLPIRLCGQRVTADVVAPGLRDRDRKGRRGS